MAGLMSVLLGEQSVADLGLSVFGSIEETKRQRAADSLKQKELEYKIAREKSDAAASAAQGVRTLIWSNLVKGMVTFALLVTGGAVLGTLIKKIVRRK